MSFIVYNNFNNMSIIKAVNELEKNKDERVYSRAVSRLIEEASKKDLNANIFKSYICHQLAASENAFTLMAEKLGSNIEPELKKLVLKDIESIIALFNSNVFNIEYSTRDDRSYNILYTELEKNVSSEEFLNTLILYYKTYGCGEFGLYPAFKWNTEKGLVGITECDPVRLDSLIGCEYQKNALIKNTENFLEGKQANNALLFGDSGTGKSSMVKALLNEYRVKGLRIIELAKSDFNAFNQIVPKIRNRGLKFIIFLDDLSFEEFETEYKYMKALIEGGIEIKPQNVIIYATSNRRHLIRETWDERQGQDVNVNDTRQEKLSLSDRFGLSLTFTSPLQNGYLEIVKSLAVEYNIDLDENMLREEAIKWELSHGGRSGRVAKQFILSLL